MPRLPIIQLISLAEQALRAALLKAAQSTEKFLVQAEIQGFSSHGISRIPFYCAHLDQPRKTESL
jgi:(2R)-3-sulfolactate dehydrogenase (NADP+)